MNDCCYYAGKDSSNAEMTWEVLGECMLSKVIEEVSMGNLCPIVFTVLSRQRVFGMLISSMDQIQPSKGQSGSPVVLGSEFTDLG